MLTLILILILVILANDHYVFLQVNPIRSGEGLYKPPPPIFCSHAFNFGAALLCVGDFSPKNSLTPFGEKFFLMGGHDLTVRGVLKYKVDMIFIIFREFNTMLEIVDS